MQSFKQARKKQTLGYAGRAGADMLHLFVIFIGSIGDCVAAEVAQGPRWTRETTV
jgi:hypothetical protein